MRSFNAGNAGNSNNINETRFTNLMAVSYDLPGFFLIRWILRSSGHSSAVAFSFDADDCSIMLSAATAAALM